jgi:hypothetical protein
MRFCSLPLSSRGDTISLVKSQLVTYWLFETYIRFDV